MADANDLLMNSGGRPWAKWGKVGDTQGGEVIAEPQGRQSRNFETNEPDSWPNGDPKMEVVVPVQTDERDPDIDDDDGTRAIVLPVGTLRFKAVQDAVRKSGAKGIEVGGKLFVTFSGEKPHEKRGYNPIKQFSAVYTPPQSSGSALDDLVKTVRGGK